jgi:hypothetical protein
VEGDRGLEAAQGLLWRTGMIQGCPCSWLCCTHLSPPATCHSPSSGPPGGGAASGTGGGSWAWGLLWAEPGPVGRAGCGVRPAWDTVSVRESSPPCG